MTDKVENQELKRRSTAGRMESEQQMDGDLQHYTFWLTSPAERTIKIF